MEFVNLRQRRRSLVLKLAFAGAPSGEVALSYDGEEIARQPASERVRLGLSADLPLGRVPLDLSFEGVEEFMIREVALKPVLGGGDVRFVHGAIVQSPWSAVDFVQKFPPGSVLLGSFQPPRSSGANQLFELLVEVEGSEPQAAFQWREGGPQDLRVELPESELPIRVRLAASGEGEPARWDGLRVSWSAPEPPTLNVPEAPRVVVLYVMDALRADYLGHLGGPEGVSPTIDRLASEGATFTDHSSAAPNTKPSVKQLFIGKPFLLRGHDSLPRSGPQTLAGAFTEGGYRTFSLSASPWVGRAFGTDRGFDVNSARAQFRTERNRRVGYNNSAERVHATALEAFDALEEGERGFFYLHTMHPHNPYLPPEPYLSQFTGGIDSTIDGRTPTLMSLKAGTTEATAADQERLRGLYAGGLAYNDAQLTTLLDELERRFEPGEVLLILTSDHGEELFDHGGVLHGYTLYDEQLRIPLIAWWPGVIEPRRIDTGTDHFDLHATLRVLVEPEFEFDHGLPLWGLMDNPEQMWAKPVRFAAASSLAGGIFSAQSRDLKLVWAPRANYGWGMGQGTGRSLDFEYVFDLRNDPDENVNLAALGGLEYDWLRSRLTAWIERGKLDEVGADSAEVVDDETLERLRALGYVD